MDRRKWFYEKFDTEKLEVKSAPANDPDGSITGESVMNLQEWFDENPEKRKRLGWIKHIVHYLDEYDYDRQTQYYTQTVRRVDEYTVEDVFHIKDKTEEMMELEEMLGVLNASYGYSRIMFVGEDFM